jgi:hypothetical protein
MVHHSLGTEFHNDWGFESLMAGIIHHSTGWGSLVATTVQHILDHGSLVAGNRRFPYRELPQALVAAREGTLGELTRYIADRDFSWREQAWALQLPSRQHLVSLPIGLSVEGTGLDMYRCPMEDS